MTLAEVNEALGSVQPNLLLAAGEPIQFVMEPSSDPNKLGFEYGKQLLLVFTNDGDSLLAYGSCDLMALTQSDGGIPLNP